MSALDSLAGLLWPLAAYALLVNVTNLVLAAIAAFELQRHRALGWSMDLAAVFDSPVTPPVSVIVPAHNEEQTLTQSVRSLLDLDYPEFEVIVVNDGSTDSTLQRLRDSFTLAPSRVPVRITIPNHGPIRTVYQSETEPHLRVIDKAAGGSKADALNAGVNAARYPLVCCIDADSLLERRALLRAARPFMSDPDVLAVGGIVRLANGCTVAGGQIAEVRLPASCLAMLQVVEYLRAFLLGRLGWSALNGLLIVSGAFAVFRTETLRRVGGYDPSAVGEDMDLVVRIHRAAIESGRRGRVVFLPDPVCWTQAPERLRDLATQRRRWHRGLSQVIHRHLRLTLNPRYGRIGVLAMPYQVLIEFLGPIAEALGYAILPLVLLGGFDTRAALAFFLAAVVAGVVLSMASMLLAEFTMRRYPRPQDLLRLALFSVLENFGYRQATVYWRLAGLVEYLRGKRGWGQVERRRFERTEP